MESKKFLYSLLTYTIVFICLIAPACATEVHNDVIWLEDMEYELIDLSAISYMEENAMLRSSGSINADIPLRAVRYVDQPISLVADDTVTFNCSYSPSSTSMDFGVIAPNGRFYYINVKEGSINQAIRISQSGSYQVAIRNNSSQAVRVVGFVNY